jgi:uncharacterized protein YbjT (DUF2867 family)
MIDPVKTVLVVGATGSIGRLVVEVAFERGYTVRAVVRDRAKARNFPEKVQVLVGDVTRPETLSGAVEGVDAIVFTLGSDGSGKAGAQSVDYGGVRNVLRALGSRKARIALMTSIGVTNRTGSYNRSTESHDWKRRAERLVRASGNPYTIVHPGWFDYNSPNEHRLIFLQGDKRQTGTPKDGVIARRQIAEVLVRSLTSVNATRMTLELIAAEGAAQSDLEPLFAGSMLTLTVLSRPRKTRTISRWKTNRSACGMISTRCSRNDPPLRLKSTHSRKERSQWKSAN